jgi:hypothetical protein
VKSGGVWQGPITSGNLRVRSGGPSWRVPAFCKVKSGGQWVDTGYRGYPNPPQGIWVHAWDFNNVTIGFSAPASGGVPVSTYRVVQTDAVGNWMAQQPELPGSPSNNFSVSQDGRYQFFVQSMSGFGIESAWTGPVKVQIGHSEQGYWGTEYRTRGWSSEHLSGARNDAQPFQVYVPNSVTIQGMHWRNLQSPIADFDYGILSPVPNRTVNWVYSGGVGGPINNDLGTVWNHNSTDRGFYNNGGNNYWGIIPLGAGWAGGGAPVNDWNFMLWVDDLWCDGFETYPVSVYYVTRSYQGNTYW